jgi:integrase
MYLANILALAVAEGARPGGPNPAEWKGNLSFTFNAPRSKDVKKQPALPWEQAPAFAAKLRETDSVQVRALEFLMLTATRMSDVLEAKWEHVVGRTWTVPETKNEKKLQVHLSDRAIEILQSMPQRGPYVFVGRDDGSHIDKKTLQRAMARIVPSSVAVPHGLRSTFKDWATKKHFKYEAVEMALDHAVGSEVERRYQRDGLPQERERLLMEWAAYLSRPPVSANVVAMLRKA